MKFIESNIKGAVIVRPDLIEDERGFFARTFCRREFEKRGLNPDMVQCNISFNKSKGTLRGLHYQAAPDAEAKLVRCTAGAIYDVIVDLRRESPTFMQWFSVELTDENRLQLYVPEGFAHGYQTLTSNTEVAYQVSAFYSPGNEQGVRWNDPVFGISWPLAVAVISEKDASHPDWGFGG